MTALEVIQWLAVAMLIGSSGVAVFAAGWFAKELASPTIRWLRWTIRCRRGERCARLSTVRLDAPPGAVVRMEYICTGCGTHYLGEAMALGEGHWSETSRERVDA